MIFADFKTANNNMAIIATTAVLPAIPVALALAITMNNSIDKKIVITCDQSR